MAKEDEYKKLRNDVYTLFYYSNKPYGISELVMQFKGEKKSVIEKILADLVKKEAITEKINGKSKIYYLSQERVQNIIEEEGLSLDEYKKKYEEALVKRNEAKEAFELLNKKYEVLNNELCNEELIARIEYLKSMLERKETQDILREKFIDPTEFEDRKKELEKLKKIEIQRKRVFNEIVNSISEGLGIKKKDFLEEAGLM